MNKRLVTPILIGFALMLLTACSKNPSTMMCLPESEANSTVNIKGGEFKFGDNRYYPNEGPIKVAQVADFNIDKTEVTNGHFKSFVDATDYVPAAERGLSDVDFPEILPEFRVPGSMVFVAPDLDKPSSPATWWQFVSGANWQNPKGPDSSIAGKEAHPVVQVTHADAIAYAQWLGRRLPTEAAWEYASRGGLEGASFSWGEERRNGGASKANHGTGPFPYNNLNKEGIVGHSH